jgi:LysM repeat protein
MVDRNQVASDSNVVSFSFHPQVKRPRQPHQQHQAVLPDSVTEVEEPIVVSSKQLDVAPVKIQPVVQIQQPDKIVYVVEPGDRLDKISMKFFQTHHRHRDILKANPGLNPKRLRPGMEIVIPSINHGLPLSKTVYITRPVASSREYVIQPGDVLGSIAQRELGSIKHVSKIKELNPGLKPSKLKVGQVLRLPVGGLATSH